MIYFTRDGQLAIKDKDIYYRFLSAPLKDGSYSCAAFPDNKEEDVLMLKFDEKCVSFFEVPQKLFSSVLKDTNKEYQFAVKPMRRYLEKFSKDKVTQKSYAIAIANMINIRSGNPGLKEMLMDVVDFLFDRHESNYGKF